MSSKAITDRPEPGLPPRWQDTRETAPSIMEEDQPHVARMLGMIGFLLAIFGGMLLGIYAVKGKILFGHSLFGPGASVLYLALGLAMMLFHAARDADLQVRRTYGVLGLLWLAAGVLLTVLPINGPAGANFLPWGFLCLVAGLLFLLPFLRNETDETWRNYGLYALGLGGVVLAGTGLVGGALSASFLLPVGLLCSLLGLAFLWAFLGSLPADNDLGFWTMLVMGVAGTLVILYVLGVAIFWPLLHSWRWISTPPDAAFLPTSGFLLLGLGLLYLAVAVGLYSDHTLMVLTRRELAAFFYSPIAYIGFGASTVVALINYNSFVGLIDQYVQARQAMSEPIVQNYIYALLPVVMILFTVPALTMRLVSEEKRTGTMEVLLTAPVDEIHVVLSKFIACLIVYVLIWLPWGIFLLDLRIENNQPFDYRPLISFFIALVFSGAALVSMGLFFSCLTRNQIIAAILTAVGLLALLGLHLFSFQVREEPWKTVLSYVSFLDLWRETLRGVFNVRDLLFHLSATVFWLFLSVKVLEARKWT